MIATVTNQVDRDEEAFSRVRLGLRKLSADVDQSRPIDREMLLAHQMPSALLNDAVAAVLETMRSRFSKVVPDATVGHTSKRKGSPWT